MPKGPTHSSRTFQNQVVARTNIHAEFEREMGVKPRQREHRGSVKLPIGSVPELTAQFDTDGDMDTIGTSRNGGARSKR